MQNPSSRTIMVLLFVLKNCSDGLHRMVVPTSQAVQLMTQVPQYHALYRDCRDGHCLHTQNAADDTEDISAARAQPIAAATW